MKKNMVMLFLIVTFVMNFSLSADEGFADGDVDDTTTDQRVSPNTEVETSPLMELEEETEESTTSPVVEESSFE